MLETFGTPDRIMLDIRHGLNNYGGIILGTIILVIALVQDQLEDVLLYVGLQYIRLMNRYVTINIVLAFLYVAGLIPLVPKKNLFGGLILLIS